MDGWMGGWVGHFRIPDWLPRARCGGLGEIGSTIDGPVKTKNVAQTLQVHPKMVGCGIHQLHHRSTAQCRGAEYKALNYPGGLGMYTM